MSERGAPVVRGPAPQVMDPARLDALGWGHRTGRFRALGFDFAVRTSDGVLGRYVERILSALAVDDEGPPRHLYSLWERSPRARHPWVLYLDDRREVAARTAPTALSFLLWNINRQVVEASDRLVLVHAAGVERAGRAVLMPAPMEAGKTTLAAGLVDRGLGYLTDEAVALDPATGLVHPYPKPLTIAGGSRRLFEHLDPPVEPAVERYTGWSWQVPPDAIRPGATAAPCRPATVILPEYREGARTRMVPISRGEALVALCENAFNLERMGRRGFEALGRAVSDCACYRLVSGDLESACEAVLGVAAEVPSEPVAVAASTH